jgi:pseudaminic acid synthase
MVEIVAELSGNHGGSLNKAIDMIALAADCGCDYAKFQFYRPEDMPDRHENDAMYRKLMVPDDWLPDLFGMAKEACIGLFASVFSVRAVETLLKFDVPYIKIASPESTRLDDQTYRDIFEATPRDLTTIISGYHQSRPVNSLKIVCPSGHPPSAQEIWEELCIFDPTQDWGFSDHTRGIGAPLAFIRHGAQMVEKHFKIDDDSIDAAFSADSKTIELLCKLAHR